MGNFQGLVCALALAVGTTASADIVSLGGDVGHSGEQSGADFSGTIEYTFNGGSSGIAVISLTNDTPIGVGGFLTGFVFNIDSGDDGASATLSATTNSFFFNTGPQNASPFGDFDAGASLGANWQGGGAPSNGLGVGQSGVFTFDVVSADAGSLTASSFMNGPNEFDFVVRFRGLNNGGSDKVPVPAPAGLAALVLAGGLAGRRRR